MREGIQLAVCSIDCNFMQWRKRCNSHNNSCLRRHFHCAKNFPLSHSLQLFLFLSRFIRLYILLYLCLCLTNSMQYPYFYFDFESEHFIYRLMLCFSYSRSCALPIKYILLMKFKYLHRRNLNATKWNRCRKVQWRKWGRRRWNRTGLNAIDLIERAQMRKNKWAKNGSERESKMIAYSSAKCDIVSACLKAYSNWQTFPIFGICTIYPNHVRLHCGHDLSILHIAHELACLRLLYSVQRHTYSPTLHPQKNVTGSIDWLRANRKEKI